MKVVSTMFRLYRDNIYNTGENMTSDNDFEQVWQNRLRKSLTQEIGEIEAERICSGGNELSAESPSKEVINWTLEVMDKLMRCFSEEQQQMVMLRCACHYPTGGLSDLIEYYAETKNLKGVHQKLQERFELFLREGLKLGEDLVSLVIHQGWGMAGILDGNLIRATKIPKSRNLEAYLRNEDPNHKRQNYCHCPRVRKAVELNIRLPAIYCYCGAGYYQHIWETILQRKVKVHLVESVLTGGDLCRVLIQLPSSSESQLIMNN